MANRYWVGGTGTWDASDTTHWSATSGGAGGASVPGSGDTVTFDGSSGGGTITLGYSPTVTSITMGGFTGTFTVGANNPTMQSFNCSGSGTRTLNMGSGTWTLTGTGTVWNFGTTTNLTYNVGTSTVTVTDTSASSKTLNFAGPTAFNALTIPSGGSGAIIFTATANRPITTLNITGPKTITFNTSGSYIVTNLNITGSAGNLVTMTSNTPGTRFTLSVATGLVQARYASIQDSLATGGATFVALNSTNAGNNLGWNFTAGRTTASNRAALSAGAAASGVITVTDYQYLAGKNTEATITITDFALMSGGVLDLLSGEILVTEGVDFDAVTSNNQTAINMAAAIDIAAGESVTTVNGASILLSIPGDADGGLLTWSAAGLTPTNTVFAGGFDATSLTTGGATGTFGAAITMGASNTETAENIATYVNAAEGGVVTAVADTNTVSITYDTVGATGNSFALSQQGANAGTISNGLSLSGASLTGGIDANTRSSVSARATVSRRYSLI